MKMLLASLGATCFLDAAGEAERGERRSACACVEDGEVKLRCLGVAAEAACWIQGAAAASQNAHAADADAAVSIPI
jgi:hypothetical protein